MTCNAIARMIAAQAEDRAARATCDLANARLPRAELLPNATYHGHIDLVAIRRVMEGRLSHRVLDDDHKLYAVVNRPEPAAVKARLLGIAERTVSIHMAKAGGGQP